MSILESSWKFLFLPLFIIFTYKGVSQDIECLNVLNDSLVVGCEQVHEDNCKEYLGYIELYDESRLYSQAFCNSFGDSITYINSSGDEMYLEIKGIYNTVEKWDVNMNITCRDDLSKTVWYCLKRETIRIEFELSEFSERFSLSIYPSPERRDPDPDKIGDYLEISFRENRKRSTRYTEFIILIDKGTQDYGPSPRQIRKGKIKVLGETFRNITTIRNNNTKGPILQYYLSKAEGIVAFVDAEGEVWRLKY